jgi:hypothetical protein
MNYCYNPIYGQWNNNGWLSQWDIFGVQSAYGKPPSPAPSYPDDDATPVAGLSWAGVNDTGGEPLACTDQCDNYGETVCATSTSYQRCGDFDNDGCSEWVSFNCDSGMTCSQGVCSAPACTNQCAVGEKSCSGDDSLTCGDYDGDGCTEWGNAYACPNYGSGYHCNGSNGYCQQTCASQCSAGSKTCSGDYSYNCGDYDGDSCTEWGNPDYCPTYGAGYHCNGSSGYCEYKQTCANQCSWGSKGCSGDYSYNCSDYDGDGCTEWGNPDYCPAYGPGYYCNGATGFCELP